MSSDDEASMGPGSNPALIGDFGATSSPESSDDERDAAPVRRRAPIGAPAAAAASSRSAHGMTKMVTMTGTKEVPMTAGMAKAADNSWKHVRVQYYLAASLRELAEGKEAVLKLDDNATKIFDDATVRSKNHICGGMSVPEIESDFPVSLHIDVEGIKTDQKTKSVTHQGSAGMMTLMPRSAFSHEVGYKIAEGNYAIAEESSFLKDYPGWTLDNVDKGIKDIDDDDDDNALLPSDDAPARQKFVRWGHPLIAFFNKSRRDEGVAELTVEDLVEGTQYFNALASDVDACLAALKKILQERLQVQDLHKVQFRLSRARGDMDKDNNNAIAWTDPEEVLDGVQSEKTREALLMKKHKIYFTVDYKVRTLEDKF